MPPPRQANKIKVFGDINKNIDNFKNIFHNSDVLHLKLKNKLYIEEDKIISKLAFTLAEVLITLGIIGIVAALTLPSVITKYQKKEAATRLEHAYAVVYQAIKMSEAVNGPMEDWQIEGINDLSYAEITKNFVERYITPYLTTVNKKQLPSSGMPYDYYYRENGKLVNAGGHTYYSIALNNGTYLHFNADYGQSNPISLRIDINGEKKPNIAGRDTFHLYFFPKFEFEGSNLTRTQLINGCKNGVNRGSVHCGRIIQMDGWQIKDDYPW